MVAQPLSLDELTLLVAFGNRLELDQFSARIRRRIEPFDANGGRQFSACNVAYGRLPLCLTCRLLPNLPS